MTDAPLMHAVYIGIFDIEKFRWTLFDLQPTAGRCSSRMPLSTAINGIQCLTDPNSCSYGFIWQNLCHVDATYVRAVHHLRAQPHQPGHLR
jgi:hypothetical protein